jgi:putative solute:sodium symporter small subunit
MTRDKARDDSYWKANMRLIFKLLFVWGAVSFGCGILFVEALNKIAFFGVPFGFWMAHQGSIYVFVVLVLVYALRMDKLDHKFHLDTDDDDAQGDQ